jgi:hypothetical protein
MAAAMTMTIDYLGLLLGLELFEHRLEVHQRHRGLLALDLLLLELFLRCVLCEPVQNTK